jgi:hypothetical protein
MTHCLSLGPLVLFHVCMEFILLKESSPEHTFPVQVLRCETEKGDEDMGREGRRKSALSVLCEFAQTHDELSYRVARENGD